MEIKIKEMEITNFKGIRNMKISFNEGITEIRGGNGTGKTSIADAFMWLLFGKDSRGRSEFAVKTLDSKGREIPKIEHSVKGVFEIEGNERVLSKSINEKWVKRRGTGKEIFMGNECVYEIDGAVLKQWEYQRKISDIIDEDVFMLVTNPMIFTSRKWQIQRKVLMDMAGLGCEYDIAREGGFDCEMFKNKSADEILRETGDSRKKLEKEKEYIPIRIDEIKRNMKGRKLRKREIVEGELYALKDEIFAKECEIKELKRGDGKEEKLRADLKRAKAVLNEKKAEYDEKCAEIKSRNAAKRYEYHKKIRDAEYERDDLRRLIIQCEKKIKECEDASGSLEREIKMIETSKFEESCPLCGRKWDSAQREKRFAEYEKNKKTRLEELKNKTDEINNKMSLYESEYALYKKREAENENSALGEFEEEEIIKADLSEYEEEVKRAQSALESCHIIDTSKEEGELMELRRKAGEKEAEISAINSEWENAKRISELDKEYENIQKSIGEMEAKEDEIKNFIKYKVDIMAERVNSKFNIVKFRLFDYYINGGYSECCEAGVKGVPFSDLNSAMKINAGLDIIRTLQRYYNIYAPVFIDNSESINEICPVDSQLICLKVTGESDIVVR